MKSVPCSISILLAAVFVAFFGLVTPATLSDDMVYRCVWQPDETADWPLVESLADVVASQRTHYLVNNGRTVVHTLAQLFLCFAPGWLLPVLNGLLFGLLLWLVGVFVAPDQRRGRQFAVALASALLVLVISGFKTAMLWNVGSLNYLWPLTATMALLLWLRRVACRRAAAVHWLTAPAALLVGWTHEALSLPLSVALAAWLLVNRRQALRSAVLPYALCYFAGTALCLLSPGIWNRAADAPDLTARLLAAGINLVRNVRISWLLGAVMTVCLLTRRTAVGLHLRRLWWLYVAWMAALGITLLCGTTLERVAFFTDFMALLLLADFLAIQLPDRLQRPTAWGLLLAVAFVFVLGGYYGREVRACSETNWSRLMAPGDTLVALREPSVPRSFMGRALQRRFLMPMVDYGFHECYQAFDADDINLRCAAKLARKPRVAFIPEQVFSELRTHAAAFDDWRLCDNGELCVWRLPEGRAVRRVVFEWDHGRQTSELEPRKFKVLVIGGERFLFFTRPVGKVYRQLSGVRLESTD